MTYKVLLQQMEGSFYNICQSAHFVFNICLDYYIMLDDIKFVCETLSKIQLSIDSASCVYHHFSLKITNNIVHQ
jgi:hypothetical protein